MGGRASPVATLTDCSAIRDVRLVAARIISFESTCQSGLAPSIVSLRDDSAMASEITELHGSSISAESPNVAHFDVMVWMNGARERAQEAVVPEGRGQPRCF